MGSCRLFQLFCVDLLTSLLPNDATSFPFGKRIVFQTGKYSLPKREQRRPACTFSPAALWLPFFSWGLSLLVPRIAAVDFSRVALAGLPGLEPTLVQSVASEEGAWSSSCSHGPKSWVEGTGQQGDHECPTWGSLLNAPPVRWAGPLGACYSFFFSPLLSYHVIAFSEEIQVSSHDRTGVPSLL